MNPVQVLDHKADLVARLTTPLVGKAWRHQLGLDMQSAAMPEDLYKGSAAAIISTLGKELPGAAAYHVNTEMTQLTVFAASQLDEMDRCSREILPTASGIVRFDGGMPFTDVRGKALRVSWIVWLPVVSKTYKQHQNTFSEPDDAVMIYLFNDHIEEPDQIYAEMIAQYAEQGYGETDLRAIFGRWGFLGCEYLYDHMRLGPAYQEPDETKVADIVAAGDIPHAYTNPLRLAHAFWLLLGQTVTSVADADVTRLHRKRAERRGIPPRVVVITLRNRAAARAEGESLVEWSHRWLVRGHWRWQVCGPDHPLAQEIEPGVWRARLWILPYVKGPEGKPLIISEKVYALHR